MRTLLADHTGSRAKEVSSLRNNEEGTGTSYPENALDTYVRIKQ